MRHSSGVVTSPSEPLAECFYHFSWGLGTPPAPTWLRCFTQGVLPSLCVGCEGCSGWEHFFPVPGDPRATPRSSALFPSPLPAPKFANVIKQRGCFHLIMVMITHTNTARESNLINFNFRGLESVLMQLFITRRKEKWGLAAGMRKAGHRAGAIFQALEAAISQQTPLIPSWQRLNCRHTPCRDGMGS